MIIHKIHSLDSNRKNPGSCAPSRPEQSTISSMWISELKLNMQEHRLITSQWWKLLTYARGTTNNDNGPQGTIGTIYGMWTVSWRRTLAESSDQRSMMKTLHQMRRSCHWGMQALRYQKGVSRSASWIMSWSRQEVTLIEGGPWCFPHHRRVTEEHNVCESGSVENQR